MSFARALSPIASIADAGGPTNTIPAAAQARANSAFSDKNPYPGWIASAPLRFAAASNASIFKYDSATGAGPM
jgi:hypothetical protein